MKVPNLAIHLTAADARGKFEPNTETHLRPIISTFVYDNLLNGN